MDGWEAFCDFHACSIMIIVELCYVLLHVEVFGLTCEQVEIM